MATYSLGFRSLILVLFRENRERYRLHTQANVSSSHQWDIQFCWTKHAADVQGFRANELQRSIIGAVPLARADRSEQDVHWLERLEVSNGRSAKRCARSAILQANAFKQILEKIFLHSILAEHSNSSGWPATRPSADVQNSSRHLPQGGTPRSIPQSTIHAPAAFAIDRFVFLL
jgi:hypothetical protein